MKAYVIALDDQVYEEAVENLRKLPVKLHKFNAIRGSTLQDFDPTIMTIGAYRSIVYDKKRRTHADLGSFNAVGCAMSHATLWKTIRPGEGVYIFESDAILKENPVPYVEDFLRTANPHVLFFGVYGNKQNRRSHPKMKRLNSYFFGLHGYYITYEGAQVILRHLFPIEQQLDAHISDLLRIDALKSLFGLNAYHITPMICQQSQHVSSIQTKAVVKR